MDKDVQKLLENVTNVNVIVIMFTNDLEKCTVTMSPHVEDMLFLYKNKEMVFRKIDRDTDRYMEVSTYVTKLSEMENDEEDLDKEN